MSLIRHTTSLCPLCFRKIEASYEEEEDGVYLKKTCPDHGSFKVIIWPKGLVDFKAWSRPKLPSYPISPKTQLQEGCPFDCGLCSEHTQHTCTALLEVTLDCNLNCPVCYAGAGKAQTYNPSLSQLEEQLEALQRQAGACNLQISGGEPTVREDLAEIVKLAAKKNFPLIQLNTNGLRLSQDPKLAKTLADAGLDSVYLSWDGVREETFRRLRGRPCLDFKFKALEACLKADLAVVLVATLVKGINDGELGDLLRFAVKQDAQVRGLHLQPCAFFGRFPFDLLSAPRLTLPQVMAALIEQAPELVAKEDFHPPCCEPELCSFSAVYRRDFNGSLKPISKPCSCVDVPLPAAEGARISRHFTAVHWASPKAASKKVSLQAFEDFLKTAGADKRFTLSAMAFQDALSLDISRVRGCCIHVVKPDGGLIPFCLNNLPSLNHKRLYGN
ncbi:MAG: radical SAM protein [Desulfovibrionaceae bacterium]|nr:radical SAM protein [Desulfovibrionaceae bacterium]